MLQKLQSRGFEVTDEPAKQLMEISDFTGIDFAVVPVSRVTLTAGFDLIRHINRWRFSTAREESPEIVAAAITEFPAEVAADLVECCCKVVLAHPDQVLHTIETARAYRRRLRTQGPLLMIVRIGDSTEILLVGPEGKIELIFNGREVRLILKLASERRAFSSEELACVIGCHKSQVRVYVERIRDEYDQKRVSAGILVGGSELIKNWGKGMGYRLHARIKGQP
jgi:hypothetical protein